MLFYLIERVTNDFLIFNRLDKFNKQIELFIVKKKATQRPWKYIA